jgi:outer membrane protein assembly factor BamB
MKALGAGGGNSLPDYPRSRHERAAKLGLNRIPGYLLAVLALATSSGMSRPALCADWMQFGGDAAGSGAPAGETGITAANLASLQRRQVALDGTVDAAAIYLHDIEVKGARHDVFFVTTTYGRTIAIDADQGSVLWEYAPPKLPDWQGSRQITTSTPVADPDRRYIYAAAPDGTIQKLAVADGHALWIRPISYLPVREKIASPLREFRGRIIAVTTGYYGDSPPYQGHIVILDAQNGGLLHVWNSLCSGQLHLLVPSECPSTKAGVWGRAGAVIDAATGDIFIATGNGPYNGKTDWGDSTIELDGDAAQIRGNFTPANNAKLEAWDLDLGSTSPVLLGDGLLAQGGKDKQIRLLELKAISGVQPHQGSERQVISTPSGAMLFTAPAVWRSDATTWMFVADGGATAAWTLDGGRLVERWKKSNGGTSPIVAGGLLYVYDPKGKLRIYEPTTGSQVAELAAGSGHWNSPIVADGRIALPEGDSNRHATSGVLDIWSVAASK